jgi:hypothetical protein
MEYNVTLPPQTEKKDFPLFPEGEAKFQIIDFKEFPEKYQISLRCESVDGVGVGKTIFYNVATVGDFLWLTAIFLKCIGEPYEGDVKLNPSIWIGRQFWGQVKHSPDGKYANIKKLIYKEMTQPAVKTPSPLVSDPKDIVWED